MQGYIIYPMLLAVGLGMILVACELFTNGIEWAGNRLGLSHGATGSVLAAVGTALPETAVPIIALASGAGGADIAVGAIAGSPFMLATLAMSVSGAAYFVFRRGGKRPLDFTAMPDVVMRDLGFFIAIYGTAVAAAFLPVGMPRYVVAAGLVCAYVVYFRKSMAHKGDSGDEPEELHLCRVFHARRNSGLILVQVLGGLGLIVLGADVFVMAVKQVSAMAGVPVMLLSLFVAPVATELPEKINSVLWIRQGKDTLAIGNITGAMVFQASFPVAIGVAFTPWQLGGPTMVSAFVALGAACILLAATKAKNGLPPGLLLAGGLLYAAFAALVLSGAL
jgi:cation:H+ antiporter